MPDILFENVDSILDEFRDLEDPRSSINRRHLLGDLIVFSIMAVIAGADGPTTIGTWATNVSEQSCLAKTLRLELVKTTEGQAQRRDATPGGRLERRLPGASP